MKHLKLLFLATFCCLYGFTVFAQPENLYIIGGPFNANKNNWIFRDIVQLEKDASNPGIFYYRGYIGYNTFGDERGNFKILTSNNNWDGFHPEGDVNQLIGAAQVGVTLNMREGGADTKWFIPDDRSGDGYYTIKVDAINKTFLIENFTANSSPQFPVGLFLVGGPFIINVDGWSVDESVKMVRDNTNPNLFHFRSYMERNQWGVDPGHFKILINARSWDDSFHPGGEEDVLLTTLPAVSPIRHGGSDKKWYLPEDGSGNGYWDFTIDAVDNTLTINSFTHDFDYFNNVYITGEAMPCGWTNSTPEIMTKVSRGVYSWKGILKSGEFKFLKYLNNWSSGYVAGTNGETVILNNNHGVLYVKDYNKTGNDNKFIIDQNLANQTVEIVLDLNAKTMKVIQVPTSTENLDNNRINITSVGNTIRVNGTDENLNLNVFSLDGRQVVMKQFKGSTEMTLQKGAYIVVVSNQSDLNIRKKIVIY